MGQASAAGPPSPPQHDDELCTCVRQWKERAGQGKPPALPSPKTEEATPTEPSSPDRSPSKRSSADPSKQPSPQESRVETPRSPPSEDPQPQPQPGPAPQPPSAYQPQQLTPRTIIGECGAFSSYARPQEVEYWDADGDWTVFARNDTGRIDLLVNGQLALRDLLSVRVDGYRLEVEGTSCDGEWSARERTSVLVTEEALARGRRPLAALGGEQDILRRLDRSEEANEDLEDTSHYDTIVQRVTALFGQPEALSLIPNVQPTYALDTSERASREPGGAEDGRADMTPEGFRVLCTRHKAVYRDHGQANRSVSVVTSGRYFFCDTRSCPRFSFSDEPLEVEQWRGGRLHWSGKAAFWEGDAGLHGSAAGCTAHGCRWPPTKAAAEGQWEPGDVIFVIGYHSDAKAFAGAGYRQNLSAYETCIGCNPEDVLEHSDTPQAALRDAEVTPRQLRHAASLASTASATSSLASMDHQEQQAEALLSASDGTMSGGVSNMGHLLSASSQVRQAQLAALRVDRG